MRTRKASACRSNWTRPPTASSRRFPWTPSLHTQTRSHREWAQRFARRLNQSRRSFLVSACGAASTLLAFNAAHARAGRDGGFFEVSQDAALEPQLAAAELGKKEFIFDVQGHFVNPTGAWTARAAARREAPVRHAERAVRAGARRLASAAISSA